MLEFDQRSIEMDAMPAIPVKITMNVGNPDRAFDFAGIPHCGVGLARLEFIINRMIGVHPRALLEYDKQSAELKDTINKQIAGYDGPVNFYVDKLSEGIAQIAAAFAPGTGDRALVGFQVQRICEFDRRQELRTARRESDAGLSRRVALYRQGISALLRARMPRVEARAR